jgi:putative intracellular protease/amidase/mannose/cellobiose epimerase-like protein (N-acyl-D-glucosamine 2-epimerase family)
MAARQFCQQTSYLGFVTEIIPEDGCFKLRIRSEDYSGNDLIYAYVNSEVWYRPLPNLGGSYANYGAPDGYDPSSDQPGEKLKLYLAVGALVIVEGIYFRDHLRNRIDVRTVFLLYDQQGKPISEKKGNLMFEEPRWWLDMISAQGNTWFNVFFSDGDVNFTRYRTELNELYQPKSSLQEVAVLSRLLYGYAVTYQLTGKEKYLTALREGVKYQRDTFRLAMPDGKSVLWASYYDGTNAHLPSKSGDDKDTIPLYEQIYALAGMTMYYRITGDLEALKDILATVEAFNAYFLDKTKYGNYFSHLDPQSLSPHKESLGINHAKKNWNSVGDHIPAYLINLICALSGKPEFAGEMKHLHRMLLFLTEDIIAYFPQHDKPEDGSRLVAERFFQDWTLDKEYSWQQDRGIIGHNLKIAWNLTRVAFYLESTIDDEGTFPPNTKPKRVQLQKDCLKLARELANAMDELGGVDKFRGGCFDAVERHPTNGYNLMFTWFSTKDFWQQEQGILCYLIQMGTTKYDANFEKFKELAAAMSAFYCAFFVDQDRGGIYFRVTDIGVPIMTGEYADKGGHAKSGYHIFELCYLAHIYTMVYNNPNPFTLHFAPVVPADGKLHLAVSPDFLPKDAIDFQSKDTRVEIVGKGLPKPISRKLDDFTLELNLPKSLEGTTVNVQVTLQPKTTKHDVSQQSEAPVHIPTKGKIGVVVESHYDELEVQYLQKRLPKEGFEMELISRLWEQDMLEFQGNECHDPIRVYKDIDTVKLEDYVAFFFISGYCMDRLRYQEAPEKGKPNHSPVVNLIRKIAKAKKTTATICHSLMAFNCAPEVMKTLKVTCSHNVIDDVVNAGGTVMYQDGGVGTLDVFEYEWMVSGKTSSEMEQTVDCLIRKLNKEHGWK